MVNLKVYCIIVTYNSMKWIDKCLLSLRNSSIKLHTVVIDNNSKDETVDYIPQNYPEVHLIINKFNKGFGQANNQGIEYAYQQGATHFFLLNQDAWIHEDTIKKLIDVQSLYNIDLVSPIHLNGRGDLLDYNYFSNIIIKEHNLEYVSDIILDRIKPYYLVSNINAAAWMLSKKTIDTIGGFDPIYFHYGEDGNYCQRIKYHKGKVAFIPESYMHHDRELQGNIKAFKKNSILSILLYEYSDINNKIWKTNKSRLILHLANIKLALSFIFRFKFNRLANLINSYIKFIIKTPKIINNMRLNKKIGANWLNLD